MGSACEVGVGVRAEVRAKAKGRVGVRVRVRIRVRVRAKVRVGSVTHHVDAEVALQPLHVGVGAVQHLEQLGV